MSTLATMARRRPRGVRPVITRTVMQSASVIRREPQPVRVAEAQRIRSCDARAIGRRAGDRDRPRIDDISFLQRIFSTATIAGLDS
jgi:hypothetical protein